MKEIKKVLSRVVDGKKECITIVAGISSITSQIAIGFAVCDDDDKYDPELGYKIAKGRAEKAFQDKRSQFFRRPDVLADFALCGLNVKGIKQVPKAIYHYGPVSYFDKSKFRVFMKSKPMMKMIGMPTAEIEVMEACKRIDRTFQKAQEDSCQKK
jgi:hypothetical protein